MCSNHTTLRPSAAAFLVLSLLSLSAHTAETESAVRVIEVLRTAHTWTGVPVELPRGQAEFVAMSVEIAPGGETGSHSHPVPSFAFVLAGTLEVKLTTGAMKLVRAGEAFAEVIDVEHNGRNIGIDPVKLIVFYTGVHGQPVTVRGGE